MKSATRITYLAAALCLATGLAAIAPEADAARLGGGRSLGKQSTNVTQKQAPAAPAPQQAQQAKPATPAAPPPATPQRNRWLGPLAGIAAGLGIAALLSHLGMGGALGEMMGSMLLIAGLAIAALFAWRMLRGNRAPALAGAGAPAADGMAPRNFDTLAAREAAPATFGPTTGVMPGGGTWSIPAGFDVDDFLHIAKMYFVRLQAAWDHGDEADIRNFTSPEVFAEIKLDLVSRAGAANQTDVVTLDAQLLGVEEIGDKTLASVRLTGMIREAPGAAAEPFKEVWNLEKPVTARASWVLAGIQQE